MLNLRFRTPLAILLLSGCGNNGSTTGTGGTGMSSTSGSAAQTSSGTAVTGSATTGNASTGTGTTGAGVTTTTGTSTTGAATASSTGAGQSCMLHTSGCAMCAGTMCQSEYASCHTDTACKDATNPGGSLDMCVCNAEMTSMQTAPCFTTFDAMGATEKALGDCVQTNCKTQCGL